MRKQTSAAFALLISGLLVAAPITATASFADEADPAAVAAGVVAPVEPTDAPVVEPAPIPAPATVAEAVPADADPVETVTDAPLVETPVAESTPEQASTATTETPAPSASARALETTDAVVTPAMPTGLRVTSTWIGYDRYSVRVSWTASEGSTPDTVYHVVMQGWNYYQTSTAATSWSFVAQVQSYFRSFHAFITATNSVGTSPTAFLPGGYDLAPPAKPSAPTALSVERAHDRDSSIVRWSEPADDGGTDLTGYTVSWFDGEVTRTADVAASVREYEIANLSVGTTYSYTVTARNAIGVSDAATTEQRFTAIAPGVVRDLTGQSHDPRTASAHWDSPTYSGGAEITGYRVTVNTNPGEQVYVLDGWWPGLSSFTVPTHVEDWIEYTVEASNDGGLTYGPASTPTRIEFGAFAPDAPAVTASVSNYFQSAVTVSWAAPADNGSPITGYDVYLFEGALTEWDSQALVIADHVLGDARSYTFQALDPETTYTAAAISTNAIGDSTIPEVSASVTTLGNTPPAPASETVGEAGDITVTIIDGSAIAILPESFAGTWVYGYAYSAPVGLGWSYVHSNGGVVWDLAGAGLPLGQHHLVVLDAFSTLIGSTAFALVAPTVPAVPIVMTPVVATPAVVQPAAVVTPTAVRSAVSLAATGSDTSGLIAGALALLLIGAALTFRRRIAVAVRR